MWVRGEVKNRPSDGNLRNVANCLVAMLSGPLGPPAEIILEPEGIWGLPGAVVSVAMEVRDAAMNPLGPDAAPVGVRLNGATHRATSPLVLELGAPGRHVVTLVCGDVTRELPVNVADGPSGLAMDPPSAVAMPGDTIRFAGRLVGPEGQTLALPPGSEWRFSCPESLGTWEEPGLLRIADTGVSGGVRGECVAEEGTAEVVVAQGRLLHDGETVEGVHFTGFPVEEGPTGEVRSREGALVVSYDLGKAEATRAAYVRFDRPLGRALGFTCRLRAVGSSPWVRLACVDGDGNRATETWWIGSPLMARGMRPGCGYPRNQGADHPAGDLRRRDEHIAISFRGAVAGRRGGVGRPRGRVACNVGGPSLHSHAGSTCRYRPGEAHRWNLTDVVGAARGAYTQRG